MVNDVGKVRIPNLNLANLPDAPGNGASLTAHTEKAPRLGVDKLFIGIKAFGKFALGEGSYSSIRQELKAEVIKTKMEDRMERLATRLHAPDEEKSRHLAEWKDGYFARKFNLPTKPTGFLNVLDNMEMKAAGKTKGLHEHVSELGDLAPKKELSGNKDATAAHFANVAERIIRELDLKGIEPENRGAVFGEVFPELVVKMMDLTRSKLLDPAQFEEAARRFTSDSRMDKAEIMQIIADTLSDLRNPDSDLAMRIKVTGFENFVGELQNLPAEGQTNFLRDTASNELNLTGAAMGGYEMANLTRNFISTLPQNNSFASLQGTVGDMGKHLVGHQIKFSNLTSPETVRNLGTLANQLISAVRKEDMATEFRRFVADVMDTIKSQYIAGEIDSDIALRAHRIFSESSVVLRFVTPEVAIGKLDGQDAQRALIVLSQFIQAVANDNDAPDGFDQGMTQAYNEVKTSLREQLRDFLDFLKVPTPEQFSKDLTEIDLIKESRVDENEMKEVMDPTIITDDDDEEILVETGDVDLETLNAQRLVDAKSTFATKPVASKEDNVFDEIDSLLEKLPNPSSNEDVGTGSDVIGGDGLDLDELLEDDTANTGQVQIEERRVNPPISQEDQKVLDDFNEFLKDLDAPAQDKKPN